MFEGKLCKEATFFLALSCQKLDFDLNINVRDTWKILRLYPASMIKMSDRRIQGKQLKVTLGWKHLALTRHFAQICQVWCCSQLGILFLLVLALAFLLPHHHLLELLLGQLAVAIFVVAVKHSRYLFNTQYLSILIYFLFFLFFFPFVNLPNLFCCEFACCV